MVRLDDHRRRTGAAAVLRQGAERCWLEGVGKESGAPCPGIMMLGCCALRGSGRNMLQARGALSL
jgi:hypothetical protein